MSQATPSAPPERKPAATATAPPKKGGAVRLLILLVLLAIAVGALGYDYLVAKPAVDKAYKDIQALVDQRNQAGVGKADLVRSKDIQELLGGKPTIVEDHPKEGYTLEWYCWWGPVPFLNTYRQYIVVVYVGDEPRRFSTHHQNEKPTSENLPLAVPPAEERQSGGLQGTAVQMGGDVGGGSRDGGEKSSDAKEPEASENKTDKSAEPGTEAKPSTEAAGEAPAAAEKPADAKPAEAAEEDKPAEPKPDSAAGEAPSP